MAYQTLIWKKVTGNKPHNTSIRPMFKKRIRFTRSRISAFWGNEGACYGSFSVTFTYAVSTSFSVQIATVPYCIFINALNCIAWTKNRVELNIISLQRKIFNISKFLKSYTELSELHFIIDVYCHLQPCFDEAAKLLPPINLGHVVALITVHRTLFVNKGLLLRLI